VVIKYHKNLLGFYDGQSRIKAFIKVKLSNQGSILMIKLLDRGRKRINRWYRSDYFNEKRSKVDNEMEKLCLGTLVHH